LRAVFEPVVVFALVAVFARQERAMRATERRHLVQRRHAGASAALTHGTIANTAEPWPGEVLAAACEAEA
jgi:hypothetical protein